MSVERMASAARWRQKKKRVQTYPAAKNAQSQTGRGADGRSRRSVGHTQSARGTIKPWCCAPVGMTGRVAPPPRLTQSAWSVEGAVLWRCRACGDGSPSLWLHPHKRGRSAPSQRPRLGSSPHLPHPVHRGASQGGSVATSAHPVPQALTHPPWTPNFGPLRPC